MASSSSPFSSFKPPPSPSSAVPQPSPSYTSHSSHSSTNSFRSAISHPLTDPPTVVPPFSSSSPAQTAKPLPRHTSRSRWFFHKEKEKPTPFTPPRPSPKRPRTKDIIRVSRADEIPDSLSHASSDSPFITPHSPLTHTLRESPPRVSTTSDADDWGLDELSDDHPLTPAPATVRTPPEPLPSSASLHRDILTLRAFDAPEQPPEPASAHYLIGVYDPAAETDDWGDDFVLDSAASIDFAAPSSAADVPLLSTQNPQPSAHSFLPFSSSTAHGLPMRPVPNSAFATPILSHSSLLMFPGIGYQASSVHPSCTRVKELFARHNHTIRTHFDALVRDSGGTIALDHRTRQIYLLSGDPDLAALTMSNADLLVDLLLWKLECATLTSDHVQRATLLLAMSDFYKKQGNIHEAVCLVHDALTTLTNAPQSNRSHAIAVELEYENAVLHRAGGAIAAASRALKRATTHTVHLANQPEHPGDITAPQQRALWWQLRCKFLQAEIAYDLEEYDSAVQFYSEYIVESLTRMIGVISPPRSEDTTLGAEFMRYCLFSPRPLVLALWTTVLSLGCMKSLAISAEIASLTSLVASAFGYEDVNKAASNVRTRIKEIGVELRQQYDEISKSILQSDDFHLDDVHTDSRPDKITASPFNYSVGDFGDVGEDVVEDWDTQLEKELQITIERCDGDRSTADDPFLLGANGSQNQSISKDVSAISMLEHNSNTSSFIIREDANEAPLQRNLHSSRQQGNLNEAELRQYLGRVAGAASTLSAHQMYPKPTQPFDGQLLGPRDHENFLRQFVRSKDPVLSKRILHGLPVTPQWHPSAVCKLNFNIEPIDDIDTFNSGVQVLSPSWGLGLLEAVWKVVRSQVPLQTKQNWARRLILNSFSRVSMIAKSTPAQNEAERCDRLEMLATLIDVLRLSREVVTNSGKEAMWFSRACLFLGIIAATATPAAKAAVELFQAESRAHCGVKAVVPVVLLEKCASAAKEHLENDSEVFSERSPIRTRTALKSKIAVPPALRQSVVDLLHALYWRTKAGFDESSDRNSLERLLHAEVASSLFLTGSGISPVDGSSIDLAKEISLLHVPEKKSTKTADSKTLVDETRRVSASELILELQSLWLSLPSSAGLVRAKVSYALAYHSRVDQRDYARAERFLFDGLRSVHAASSAQGLPNSFFSRMLHVSPVAIVSSPLAGALLSCYGNLALSHSKYRYGIAAMEAATDGRRVRNMDKQAYRSSVAEVVESALCNNDWRRAITLVYNMRYLVHPKNGLRNEFLHLCLQLHRICFDVGCFEASTVPLRAYSSLIYEERLRVLLQRYKRRLAKKSRSRFRKYVSGSPLPKLLPGASVFPNRKNALASFFEAPIVASAIDTTFRHSASLIDARIRPSNVVIPVVTKEKRDTFLSRLATILWPLHLAFWQTRSDGKTSPTEKRNSTSPHSVSVEPPISSNQTPSNSPKESPPAVVNGISKDSEFEEEQRELLRIEAEQEDVADSDRFRVELLLARTEYARADYIAADLRCGGLLDMSIPHASRYKVWEIMARIRLKRREITKCLEFIDEMEREYHMAEDIRESSEDTSPPGSIESQRLSIFRLHDIDRDSKGGDARVTLVPQVTFLRLTALIHGGRLEEALHVANKALEICSEHAFWDQGRLHYLRGKVLYAMSSTSTASFMREDEANGASKDTKKLNLKMTELTMTSFETASHFYDAAGDEICAAKSDLLWARICIDVLFRRVVLSSESGGGVPLHVACMLLDRRIVLDDVVDIVYNVINIASMANVPLLLIDSMAALAEVKCIQGHPASSWSLWVSEAWKLFSRLFTDAEDFTVVLSSLAPVSTLGRLRNICGRLVRLVMCNEHVVSVADMNKHLRLFEAYVTLEISIDQKMNLASSAHGQNLPVSAATTQESSSHKTVTAKNGNTSPTGRNAPLCNKESKLNSPISRGLSNNCSKNILCKDSRGINTAGDIRSDGPSDSNSDISSARRPAGAFLHLLGNEGVALGRQGFSIFINRPRQQVISAVKGTGAVLIPANFFTNSKTAPGDGPDELGRNAEMIFPFKPSLGLGAMQILNDEREGEDEMLNSNHLPLPRSNIRADPNMSILSNVISTEHLPIRRETVVSVSTSKRCCNLENLPKTEEVQTCEEPNDNLEEIAQTGSPPRPSTSEQFHNNNEFSATDKQKTSNRNALAALLEAIRDELEVGNVQTKGSSSVFGQNIAERVWSHMHRIKTETKRYMHGEIDLEQLHHRNSDALMGWVHCIPLSRKEWTVPESIGRRLVYILFAHGVIGYYAVERGGSIERIAFGGKQGPFSTNDDIYFSSSRGSGESGPRSPTDAERSYLNELVRGFKRDGLWHKSRDSEVVNGMAKSVLRAPRLILSSSTPAQKSRSRPIVLIADLPLQILPWELFFDHVVIRSHCLLDVIRGLQEDPVPSPVSPTSEDPTIATTRRIARFISFGPSRREVLDLERTEDARRQQLAFRGLLRLNHMKPSSLTRFLDLGGFSDPTAINAAARPTGPLSSPLSQSRKAVKLFGLRISANIGRRNYPHMDFLRVSGLGSAATSDLKDAAMVLQPNINDNDNPKRDLGAYIPVFMFSYADLVDSSESVFGLRRSVPNGILMFTPAIHMKVLARHLEDEELSEELARASGRIHNRIFPDVAASARALVEYVSRFSREKRIPIVVFLGQELVDVFPRKFAAKDSRDRTSTRAAERLVQLPGGPRVEYFRK